MTLKATGTNAENDANPKHCGYINHNQSKAVRRSSSP